MIATRRFSIRDFTTAERAAFCTYHADPRYRALFEPARAESGGPEELLARFAAWAAEVPRRNYQLAVVAREGGALVGCCGLRRASLDADAAEMGLELSPDYWGRFAYAIEISVSLIEFGFAKLGLSEIAGRTQDANARAMRLAEWFGATVAVERAGPGWTEVEWRISREIWRCSRVGPRYR